MPELAAEEVDIFAETVTLPDLVEAQRNDLARQAPSDSADFAALRDQLMELIQLAVSMCDQLQEATDVVNRLAADEAPSRRKKATRAKRKKKTTPKKTTGRVATAGESARTE